MYKLIAVVLLRLAYTSLLIQERRNRTDWLLTQLDQLNRIVSYIWHYHGLHPAFARQTYGTLQEYLKHQLPAQDWSLLTQLDVVKPVQTTAHQRPVFDNA